MAKVIGAAGENGFGAERLIWKNFLSCVVDLKELLELCISSLKFGKNPRIQLMPVSLRAS